MTNMEKAAKDLASFLTEPQSQYIGGRTTTISPLGNYIRLHLEHMAREIASIQIEATPELKEILRDKAQRLIQQTLRDDDELSRVVVKAMSEVFQKISLADD